MARLPGTPPTPKSQDPRSMAGVFSRGKNNYNGSFAPQGAGRPPNIDLSEAIERLVPPQGAEGGNPVGNAFLDSLARRINGDTQRRG